MWKRFWSDALQDYLKFKVTAATIRWVDKVGGIDNYLLTERRMDKDSIEGEKVCRGQALLCA